MAADLPLKGVRVVEFTWVIAGPMITRSLAMLGAEVIRVESAKRAEFRLRDKGFGLLNNSKKSCSLDLSNEQGREVARDLVRHADIIVENFGFGVMDKLGLSYDAIAEFNPNIIMLSCSGMGRTGPERTKLAYGTLLQLNSGWSSLQGYPDSEETTIGGAWTDPLTAATGTMVILAALHDRQHTGNGQYIDLSMVEATMCGVPQALLDYELNGRVARPSANADAVKVPHGCFPCLGEDRWIAISVANDREWSALVEVMGRPAWALESKFSDSGQRKAHEAELEDRLEGWTAECCATELAERLQGAGVPATLSMNVQDLMGDCTLDARGYFHEHRSDDDSEAAVALGLPWVARPCLNLAVSSAPALGADTHYVLESVLQYAPDKIADLERAGALY